MPRLSAFFRNLFRRDHVERDLDDELRAYIELAADENRHAGLPEPAARRAALVDLGGIEQVKEHVRTARAGAFVERTYVGVALIIAGAVLAASWIPARRATASIRWWRCVTNSDTVRRVTPAIAAVLVMYGGFAGLVRVAEDISPAG